MLVMATATASAQQEQVPPGAPETPYVDPAKAYLFAHMTKARYGVLYYSVSEDGLHWRQDQSRPSGIGATITATPRSRAAATGAIILVGNKSDEDPLIRFWVSDDLIRWTPLCDLPAGPEECARPCGCAPADRRAQAAVRYRLEGKFLLSWHTPNVPGDPKEDPERYWASQRTLYVQSRDLKDLAKLPAPKAAVRLGHGDDRHDRAARRCRPGYCAIIKDERYPVVRLDHGQDDPDQLRAVADGPYPQPGPPLSPNFREAPTLIRAPLSNRLAALLRAICRHELWPVQSAAAARTVVSGIGQQRRHGVGSLRDAGRYCGTAR
jgi:hypothetical protein